MNQLTQRVRKAIKKKHSLLIDVEWIRECKLQQCRVDHNQYLLTELAEEIMDSRSNNGSKSKSSVDVEIVDCCDDDELQPDKGWSEPVSLDCCCVCHDDNRDDCKWCIDCNVTLAKKATQSK